MSEPHPQAPGAPAATLALTTEPLRFEADYEQIPDDEGETIAALTDAMREITERTSNDYGHAVRSVHAKSHGLLRGELTVFDALPAALAQGVFAAAATFPVVLRFSTNPGDILSDRVSTPRGLAIKIVGVTGERLPGAEGQVTQDFVMQNAPAFTAATPKAFLKTLKLLAKTTDKAGHAKEVLSAVLRGAEAALEAVGAQSPTIKSMGGHPETQVLGETFYTIVPFLYGPYIAKLSVAPVSSALTALKDCKVDLKDRPDGLREEINAFFANQGGKWEVRVQLCTDLEKMPIEDASVRWDEDQSPFIPVARITVAPQRAWTNARAALVDDGLAFSPWHGLAAHRPLGGIMRSRKPAYEMSAAYRSQFNGCPIHEPRALDELPE